MTSFYAHAHADALLVSLKRDPIFYLTIIGKVQSYLMAGVSILGILDGEGAQATADSNARLVCATDNSVGLASKVLEMFAISFNQRSQLGLNSRHFALKEFRRWLLMDLLEMMFHKAVYLYREEKVPA